ncbi:MAG TPA: DUF4910 domain-containing protein [Firmicutes bacterium]|nr:DUF4910 domain-containing protein [Candidatus Fermentithermobacillaceae bacterium]
MLDKIIDEIKGEFSGIVAKRHVEQISSFHRIQASPGFRQAAHYVRSSLAGTGLEAQILQYPAKKGPSFWSERSFMEWDVEEALLVLYPPEGKPERLCSFRENPVSVIQRSGATPPEGIRCQLVYVEKADDPSSYESTDVRGKVVFSSGDPNKIRQLAVEERGAVGIVLDNMNEFPPVRHRMDIADAVQYVSFWPEEVTDPLGFGFGFVVSPKKGEDLRKLLKSAKAPVEVFARVRTRFYEGTIEVVEAFIPGNTGDEVVATAHLCHPSPGANDNASGAGALIEVAAVLQHLISSGKLPRPVRGIRFLWVPEMTGTYAYLATNEEKIHRVKAAINLDMVGENQELCGSVLTIERPPRAAATFAGDVAWSVMKRLTFEAQNLAGTASYPLFRWAVSPFSGGSDHYIWSDPSVGVGCPMLIQWPDKFYHTSQDTPDKVDPHMLHVVGVAAAAYLYFLASAGPVQCSFVAREMAAHYHHEANELVEEILRAVTGKNAPVPGKEEIPPEKTRRLLALRLAFIRERKILDVESLRKLCASPGLERHIREAKEEIRRTTESVWTRGVSTLGLLEAANAENPDDQSGAAEEALPNLEELLDAPASGELPELVSEARSIIPERVFRGPVSIRGSSGIPRELLAEWESFNRKWEKHRRLFPYIGYWSDGKRNALHVSALIEAETGCRETQLVVDYVKLMEKLGYFRIRRST